MIRDIKISLDVTITAMQTSDTTFAASTAISAS